MRRVISLTLLMFMAVSAGAAERTVSWEHPMQMTDGSPLAPPIARTDVVWGPSPDMTHNTVAVLAPAESVRIDFPVGTNYVRARTILQDGNMSVLTAPIQLIVSDTPVPPNPPSNLQVRAENLTVYTVVKQTDRFVLLAVGSVPAGTQCDPTQTVNGHYAVPRAQVTWNGTAEPYVVVARCS